MQARFTFKIQQILHGKYWLRWLLGAYSTTPCALVGPVKCRVCVDELVPILSWWLNGVIKPLFASLSFVRGINRWPVNSPHKRPVTRKMFPFDDVIILKMEHQNTPMAKCKIAVSPLLTHWRYCSLAPNYRHVVVKAMAAAATSPIGPPRG